MNLKNALMIVQILFFQVNMYSQKILPFKKKLSDSMLQAPIRMVPRNYYSKNLGFICK